MSQSDQQPERIDSEHLRQISIDTMGSWALEGMSPQSDFVEDLNAYFDGEITADEFLKRRYEKLQRE